MSVSGNDYLIILNSEFKKRTQRNPSYSLRSFARDLDICSGSLSSIIKGKRPYPIRKVDQALQNLNLDPVTSVKFKDSVMSRRKYKNIVDSIETKKDDHVLNDHQTSLVTDWEHFAVLSLIKTHQYLNSKESNEDFFSNRLGLSKIEANKIVDNLLAANLIKLGQDFKLQRTYQRINTTQDIDSEVLKSAHRNSMHKAEIALDELSPEKRYFGCETFCMSRSNIEQGKKLIREFKNKFSSLLETTDSEDVYRLNIQFFPLTIEEKESNYDH